MKNLRSYKVTCLKCGGSNVVRIRQVGENKYLPDLDTDHQRNPKEIHIISARFRGDLEWGWECLCGCDSRIARQESQDVEKLVANGGKQAIEHLVDSLKVSDERKFRMVEV